MDEERQALAERARAMKVGGATVRDIAAQLGITVPTAGRWTKGIQGPPKPQRPVKVPTAKRRETAVATNEAKVSHVSSRAFSVLRDLGDMVSEEKARLTENPDVSEPGRIPLRLLDTASQALDRLVALLPAANPHQLVGIIKVCLELNQLLQGKPSSIQGTQEMPVVPEEQVEQAVRSLAPRVAARLRELRVIEGGKQG